jgi:putative OPT family oligopeptide transporter
MSDNGKTTKPFIPAEKAMPEFTPFAIILGVILALVFGGANAYLGLRVGQTVSASIPAAVISMGVIRGIFKRDSILENNMVQTIGSAGESIAGGAIFTLPVLFLWSKEWGQSAPSYLMITGIALSGGILGVLFMIPLRRALIARESEELIFPEGTACAKVLKAGESGGTKAKVTFLGVGTAALYKFASDGLKLFPSEVDIPLSRLKGTAVGFESMPALLGVGYIIGPRISAMTLAGGLLGWYCVMPLIYFFGAEADSVIYPATIPISQMTHHDIWGNYLRYIGAGAVAFGGIFSLVTSLPVIVKSFAGTLADLKESERGDASLRTERDLPFKIIAGGIILATVFLVLFPYVPIDSFAAVLLVFFGFFFSTVSARIVGIIGSSNSPISGMTITALLITTVIFKAVGRTDHAAMLTVMSIAAVICVIAAISGDTSQDLKTGYLLGATPVSQQIGEIIGVIFSAAGVGGILMLLDKAWGFGGSEVPAIQATLMKLIIEGVMSGDLPWALVISGAAVGLALAVLRLPVLPVAVGLYLPIYLSVPIAAGGLLRGFIELKLKNAGDEKGEKIEKGFLYCSGLIAGEGLVGILLATLTVLGVNTSLVHGGSLLGAPASFIAFALLGFSLLKFSLLGKTDSLSDEA